MGRGGARVGAGRPRGGLKRPPAPPSAAPATPTTPPVELEAQGSRQASPVKPKKLSRKALLKRQRAEEYAQLGPRPTDPLEANTWLHTALSKSFELAMTDPTLSEKDRRLEMRQIAKTMAGLIPAERLLAAERVVRQAADDMAKPTKDPGLTDVSEITTIPLRIPSN